MSNPTPEDVLLSVRDLAVEFQVAREAPRVAVRGISFEVPANRTVALVGESGSGKSVSALALLRLLPDNARISGSIRFEGRELTALPDAQLRALRGGAMSMVFQEPMSSLNPVFTVGEQIAEVVRVHERSGRRAAHARAIDLLEEVGLPDPQLRVHSYPHELSGGQQQRVMIAMAIACKPRLLIADEPTTALDVTIQKQVLELLATLRVSHRMSVLFISHDLGVVGEIADEVIVMQAGQVREHGAVEQIFTAPTHPYTRALLACRPDMERHPRRLPVVADFMGGKDPVVCDEPRVARAGQDIVLEVSGLTKNFRLRDGLFHWRAVPAVEAVSFTLRRGQTLGVAGESGSGKTTMGLTLMRLHYATAGRVILHGRAGATDLLGLSEAAMMPYRQRIQIIFQNPYASLNPRFTIGHILIEPMALHGIGANSAARLGLAAELLQRVGLPGDALNRYPHEFSGGQRQRIAIARCLTLRPDVLICDESVSALDVSVQAQVLNLLLDLQDEFGMAYIFISHDLAVVRYMADEVMIMNQGRAVEMADAQSIYRRPQNPYTRKLLESVPRGLAGRLLPDA
ncbi:MAG TPA: ABC transporter ATP-binding protein [Steroidobacteraceae bacterium]|nr:ABC transporter ATP-binding protein [Steroidobacteraceae bacterium]